MVADSVPIGVVADGAASLAAGAVTLEVKKISQRPGEGRVGSDHRIAK
jgi:hypothetical protein